MQFLKRHYEKIILSLVLLGLAGAAFWLHVSVEAARRDAGSTAPAPLPPPRARGAQPAGGTTTNSDLEQVWEYLREITNPPVIVLSGDHNLFNPVTWKRGPTGLHKVLREGPAALEITKISPLYLYIGFDRYSGGDTDAWYFYFRQHSERRVTDFAKKGQQDQHKLFTITATRTNADGLLEFQLDIPMTHETAWINTNQPYQHVDAYEADLKYDPDSKVFHGLRVDNTAIPLSGQYYKIVAITNNAVTVESTKTSQQTIIQWNGAP